MTQDDDFLNYYASPDPAAPSPPAGPEDADPWIPRTTPRSELPAPKRRNAWAPWSLAIALVAFVLEWAAWVFGAIYLQRYNSSWWDATALLLIVFAVAAGVRSLTLIGRDAARGLWFTVSGFFVCSLALLAGKSPLIAFVGFAASFAVLFIFVGAHSASTAASTNMASDPGLGLAANSVAVQIPARRPAKTMAVLAFVGALPGPPWSFIAHVFAMTALRRTRETGEDGRGWAIGAIIVSSIWLSVTTYFLLMFWILSQVKWA